MAPRQIAIVTGATGAIGAAIAQGLAAHGAHEVLLACRDASRGEALAARLRAGTGFEAIRAEVVDLGSRASIEALRARCDRPVQVLINNAATTPRRRETTEEGIERQLAVNVLGYIRMIQVFRDLLVTAEAPRVVNVASYWAGELEIDDLEFKRRYYRPNKAYRQSKQANRMLTVTWAEALASDGIAVNACHPGDVDSNVSRSLGFGGNQTAEDAARTPLVLALEPEGHTTSGKFFARGREAPCSFADDREALYALDAALRAYG